MTSAVMQDWKSPLQASNFTGYIPDIGEKDPAGTVFRCIALTRIPCNREVADANKIARVSLAVVKIIKRGWLNAPYKKPKTTNGKAGAVVVKAEKDPNLKPLFEECQFDGHEAMKIFHFMKANNNTDKGLRTDESFCIICPGQTLTFSLKGEYAFKEHTFPQNIEMIEPYSMVDLVLAPSSIEQAKNGDKGGYGVKLLKMRVHDSSVYSYVRDFPLIFKESQDLAVQSVISMLREPVGFPGMVPVTPENPTGTVEICPADTIRNCLENRSPMFYIPSVRVNPASYITGIRPDLDFLRVMTDNGAVADDITAIDVDTKTLLKLLNTTNELYARTLMDFALAANAVSFLTLNNDWFCKEESALSNVRAVPIIDVTKLFECVDVAQFDSGKKFVDFPVAFNPPASVKSLAISVPMKSMSVAEGDVNAPLTPDFILVSPGVKLEKAYEVQFVEGEDVLLTTFLNARAGKSPGGAEPGVPTTYLRVSRKRGMDD
jgi:hypothetical protein